MKELTAADLRDMVADAIAPTIELHRGSRAESGEANYGLPKNSPTDEEIDDFLFHNALLDEETVEQLVDAGLLGFSAKTAQATPEWLEEFHENLCSWANNQSWLAADLPWRSLVYQPEPNQTSLWTPAAPELPLWISTTPACLLLAMDLLRKEKLLSEMKWRDFEELIGALLESEGWRVKVTRASKDGGIDVVALKSDDTLGEIYSVWQAKKNCSTNKVQLEEVKALSATRDDERATKGIMVTTSRLTRGAIEWIKRDIYRLGYKEHDHIKRWIEGVVLGKENHSV